MIFVQAFVQAYNKMKLKLTEYQGAGSENTSSENPCVPGTIPGGTTS